MRTICGWYDTSLVEHVETPERVSNPNVLTPASRAFAEGFAGAGARVLAADINADGAAETAWMIRAAGGVAHGAAVDVTRAGSCRAVADRATELLGGAEILVNNPAIYAGLERKPFEEIDAEVWDTVMAGFVIVGAGHGGVQLAASLREVGYDGAVRPVSGDPDLPCHKPPLSKSFMRTPDAPLQPLRAPAYCADNAITLDLARWVERAAPDANRVVFADGGAVAYDALILATGTRAGALWVPGAGLPGVHSLRTAGDARVLRQGLPPDGTEVIDTRDEDGALKSVCHLKDAKLVACETLNSAAEHMLSRRLIAEGVTPPVEALACGDIARLKEAQAAVRAHGIVPGV